MADVGVLNLQIQADASQAAGSLTKLANALNRVKTAVGRGLSFGSTVSNLEKLKNALGGNWTGSETFKTAMKNIQEGMKQLSDTQANKLANTAKSINTLANAYEKILSTLNTAKNGASSVGKATETIKQASETMSSFQPKSAATMSSSMFGGRFAQHFNALNDVDSDYGKIANGLKQVEDAAKGAGSSAQNIKNVADAVKQVSGSKVDNAQATATSQGISIISTAIKELDTGSISNIQALATALKELKGLGGIGTNLKSIAEGLNAMSGATKKADALASAIRIDASAINRFKSVSEGFSVPSFNNLIKLAESMHSNPDASVHLKRIAEALAEIKSVGDFKVPNLSGLTGATKGATGSQDASTGAVTAMQKVGDVADETAGKLVNVGQEVQEAMTHAQTSATGAADTIANEMASILPDNMTWFVGENLTPVTGQFKTEAEDIKNSAISDLSELEAKLKETTAQWEEAQSKVRDAREQWYSEIHNKASDKGQVEAAEQTYKEIDAECKRLFDLRMSIIKEINKHPDKVAQDAKTATGEMEVAFKDATSNIANYQQETLDRVANSMQRRFAAIPKMFGNSSAEMQGYVAKGLSMSTDQLFGNANPADAAVQATQAMDGLTQATQNYTTSATNMQQTTQGTAQGLQHVQQATQGATSQVQQMQNATNAPAGATFSDILASLDPLVNSLSTTQASVVDSIMNIKNQIQSLEAEEQQMRNALATDIQMGLQDAYQITYRAAQIRLLQTEQAKLYTQLFEMEHAQKLSTRAMSALRGAFDNLRDGIKNLGITRLIGQMMRMAKMRALRYMIRELAKGFREGVENVYHYSEAIGSSFAPAMDSAATALNQMKNSIGAAVAPALQALIPLFNTIVGWITTAVNYINQFFSLLSGKSTWTKALPVATKAFDEQKKAAKGASDSVKDMLADFDELNIIQQQGNGSGSGSGSTATDYTEMFEEVNEFDSKIKDMVQWIEEHMETVKGIAVAIGVAILGWKLNKAFDGALGTIGKIITGAAIMTIGLQVTYSGAYAAGASGGFDASTILSTVGGSIATAFGGKMIGNAIGGKKGGAIGLAIGITASLFVTFKAYAEGQKKMMDENKWGTLALALEMKQQIQDMFTFEINPDYEIVSMKSSALVEARDAVKVQVAALQLGIGMLRQSIKVGIPLEIKTSAENAVSKAQELITKINEELQASEEAFTVTVKNFKFAGTDGSDVGEDLLAQMKIDDVAIIDFFKGLGVKMGEAMNEGQRTAWKNGEAEQILALTETMNNIVNESEALAQQLKLEHGMQQLMDIDWSQFTSGGAEGLAKEYDSAIQGFEEQYVKPMIESLKSQADSEFSKASTATKIADYYEAKTSAELGMSEQDRLAKIEEYRQIAENALQRAKFLSDEDAIRAQVYEQYGVNKTIEQVRDKWTDTLLGVYGDSLGMISHYLGYDNNWIQEMLSTNGAELEIAKLGGGSLYSDYQLAQILQTLYSPGSTDKDVIKALEDLVKHSLRNDEAGANILEIAGSDGQIDYASLFGDNFRTFYQKRLEALTAYYGEDIAQEAMDNFMIDYLGSVDRYASIGGARVMQKYKPEQFNSDMERIEQEVTAAVDELNAGTKTRAEVQDIIYELLNDYEHYYGKDYLYEIISGLMPKDTTGYYGAMLSEVIFQNYEWIKKVRKDKQQVPEAKSAIEDAAEFNTDEIAKAIFAAMNSENIGDVLAELDKNYGETVVNEINASVANTYWEMWNALQGGLTDRTQFLERFKNNTEFAEMFMERYQDLFGGTSGSLPAAARYPKMAYMPQEGGLGRYPYAPDVDIVLDEEDLHPAAPHWFGDTSGLFAQPGSAGMEADTRTASATEKTSRECEAQNTKIDVLTGLLRAVLGKLNGGIDVTMAPTSTAGKTVGDAMDAFHKVTGWV